ncbi:MAG: mucoidy inhibitor MuiA family protein, partial [Flavobacteriales bacterium]|nr:mucoidy inhibitor MuiA family protein [Flavobacteriales bacterium]
MKRATKKYDPNRKHLLANSIIHLINIRPGIIKKLFVLTVLITLINTSFAIKETLVKSKIKNVTIFLNGAQVFRKANFNIKKGVTDIVFDSISSNINANSIQVKGKGKYIILDTKYKYYQPATSTTPKNIPKIVLARMLLITDSLDFIAFDLEEVKFKKEVLELEKQFLISNKSMKSDSLALLKDAMSFLRAKYNDINATLIKVRKQEYHLNKTKVNLQTRLNKINTDNAKKYVSKPTYPRYQIIVTVSSEEATKGIMNVNYLVNGASWSPKYDIRATGINEPIELTYKANVYQNSGEDWNNVKLTLSTNNPNKSKVKPILPVWYLNYYTQHYKKDRGLKVALMGNVQLSYEKVAESNLLDM